MYILLRIAVMLRLGWYYGERIRDNEKGWFPANHTIEIQNAHVRARNLRHQFWLQRCKSGMGSELFTQWPINVHSETTWDCASQSPVASFVKELTK